MPPNCLVLNRQRKRAIPGAKVREFLSLLLPALGLKDAAVSVVFVTDETIRRHNRRYRGFDKATDVLSFPSGRGAAGAAGEVDNHYLGDILISAETAYNQARKSRSLTFEANVRRLLLHGLLHLMGYDHETDGGQMRSIELRLRRRFQC
jgi:probable rRNA maturation factor